MKRQAKCLVCGDVMATTFGGIITLKECARNPSHNLKLLSNDDSDEVSKISIKLSNNPATWATWHVLSRELRIHNFTKTLSRILGDPLPYFEPDLTDYNKLVNKVKLYIIFS
jgi:hypothetical protein